MISARRRKRTRKEVTRFVACPASGTVAEGVLPDIDSDDDTAVVRPTKVKTTPRSSIATPKSADAGPCGGGISPRENVNRRRDRDGGAAYSSSSSKPSPTKKLKKDTPKAYTKIAAAPPATTTKTTLRRTSSKDHEKKPLPSPPPLPPSERLENNDTRPKKPSKSGGTKDSRKAARAASAAAAKAAKAAKAAAKAASVTQGVNSTERVYEPFPPMERQEKVWGEETRAWCGAEIVSNNVDADPVFKEGLPVSCIGVRYAGIDYRTKVMGVRHRDRDFIFAAPDEDDLRDQTATGPNGGLKLAGTTWDKLKGQSIIAMEYHEWRDGQPRPPLKDSEKNENTPPSKGLGANGERPRTGAVFFLSSGGIMFCARDGTDEGGPASMANTLCRGIEPGHRLICGLPVGQDNGIPDW